MKKFLLWSSLLSLVFLLPACEDDDDSYSLGKYWVTTGTVSTYGTKPYVITTDNGDVLYPSSSSIPWFNVYDGMRVWVNYTILGDTNGREDIDYWVKINDISEILTKGIFMLTPEKEDSIGHDPVEIRDYWFTGDYLTIIFRYGGGGTIHFINLVQDVDNPENEDGLPVLELRHNRRDDRKNYLMQGTVSFNLAALKKEGSNAVSFILKAKNFSDRDDFEKELTYEYGE